MSTSEHHNQYSNNFMDQDEDLDEPHAPPIPSNVPDTYLSELSLASLPPQSLFATVLEYFMRGFYSHTYRFLRKEEVDAKLCLFDYQATWSLFERVVSDFGPHLSSVSPGELRMILKFIVDYLPLLEPL